MPPTRGPPVSERVQRFMFGRFPYGRLAVAVDHEDHANVGRLCGLGSELSRRPAAILVAAVLASAAVAACAAFVPLPRVGPGSRVHADKGFALEEEEEVPTRASTQPFHATHQRLEEPPATAGSSAFLPRARGVMTSSVGDGVVPAPGAGVDGVVGFWNLASVVGSIEGAVAETFDRAALAMHLRTITTTSTTTATTVTQTRTTTTGTSTTRTTTTLTSTTRTTTTTSTRLATLFCFSVVLVGSYEVELIQVLWDRHASIFQCEDNAVYSNGGNLTVGPWPATRIPAPTVELGNLSKAGTTTSSWLNTMIFMEAWNLVFRDGRWWNHEWTVKVDPDAVFFPDRLKVALYPYYTAGILDGPAWYVGNCDRTYHGEPWQLKVYGSLEVFSRNALGMYHVHQHQCKSALHWQGWGEDLYMEQCMKLLGVRAVNGVSFLGDDRCHPASCTDPTKIAFHAFKSVGSWLACWQASQRTVNYQK